MQKIFLLILLLLPNVSFGQIIFSEIMYDPDGSDTGYEWVEIYNTSESYQNMLGYKFCEGKPVCHSIPEDRNTNYILEGKSYAIITDDREKYLEKHAEDSLVLVSTGFVLTNTGELIQIKNADGNLEDSLTFNPVSGGGNGQTLSVFDGLWKNSEPTAGKENIEKKISSSSGSSSGSTSSNEDINTSYVEISDDGSDMFLGKKKLRAEIDEVGVIMAGSRTKFTGTAYGITGVEITGVEFKWNFGDGSKDEGQFAHHEYDFPNDYIVTLVVKSGSFTGKTKTRVKVINPSLEISDVQVKNDVWPGFIRVRNTSDEILNIEDWMLSVDGERFLIPDDTYIDKNSEIIFSESVTGLSPIISEEKKSRVAILFPNGEKFYSYDFDKVAEASSQSEEFLETEQQGSTLKNNNDEEDKGADVVEVVKVEQQEVISAVVTQPAVVKKVATVQPKVVKDVAVSLSENTLSVREQVLADAADNAESIKIVEKGAIPPGQSANIFAGLFGVANASADGEYETSEDFIQSQWPLLTLIFLLGMVIIAVLYIRHREGMEKDTNLDITKSEVDDVGAEAEEFEIEEVK